MLSNISPIDGRYRKSTSALAEFFSEAALMKYRLMVEGEYFIALSETKGVKIKKLSAREKNLIRNLSRLSGSDAQTISDIEKKGYKDIKPTDHDVKAVEYYMKDKLAGSSLKNTLEWLHFALTSEDTNNLAYGLMLSQSVNKIILPALQQIYTALARLAKQNRNLPMLARTHGQPASPTTFGKEFGVFAARLERQIKQLQSHKLLGKLNGATGNYNAHLAAYPKMDWLKFSKKFVASLGLEVNLQTTQIEPHDSYIELFDILRRTNTILIDLNQDLWRYISDGWLAQKSVAGEVGSSTMPHKINPIKFENSEGNLGLANALLEFFTRKLPVSRLQRDLSDSTVQRNFGTALGHCLVAYKYLLGGLGRIAVDKTKIKEALDSHPEILAEAIQTVLRREGARMPYEQLKELTRGKKITLKDLHQFIDGLEVSEKVKKELKKLTPQNYTGLAAKLASL